MEDVEAALGLQAGGLAGESLAHGLALLIGADRDFQRLALADAALQKGPDGALLDAVMSAVRKDRSWSAKSARAALMSCWLNASTYARSNLSPSLMGAAGVWVGDAAVGSAGRRRGAGAREEQDHSDQSHS